MSHQWALRRRDPPRPGGEDAGSPKRRPAAAADHVAHQRPGDPVRLDERRRTSGASTHTSSSSTGGTCWCRGQPGDIKASPGNQTARPRWVSVTQTTAKVHATQTVTEAVVDRTPKQATGCGTSWSQPSGAAHWRSLHRLAVRLRLGADDARVDGARVFGVVALGEEPDEGIGCAVVIGVGAR